MPEEQRRVNALAVALREVEHGCPGLSSPCQRAVEALSRMMARVEDRSIPASRPLGLVDGSAQPQGEVDDQAALVDALIATRRAAASRSISGSASRSLESTVELLELLAPESRRLAAVSG